MDIKKEKHRFTLLVDQDVFDEFKKLAAEQNRTPGNLASTIIKEYVKKNKEQRPLL